MKGLKSFEVDGSVCFFNPANAWLDRIGACRDCFGPKRLCAGGNCSRKRSAGSASSSSADDVVARIRARME